MLKQLLLSRSLSGILSVHYAFVNAFGPAALQQVFYIAQTALDTVSNHEDLLAWWCSSHVHMLSLCLKLLKPSVCVNGAFAD